MTQTTAWWCVTQTMVGQVGNGVGSSHERFSYDSAGNRTLCMTESVREEYHYDSGNRLVKLMKGGHGDIGGQAAHSAIHYRYDRQGNLLSDGCNTYTYDGFNRLIRAQMPGGKAQVNRYDAESVIRQII